MRFTYANLVIWGWHLHYKQTQLSSILRIGIYSKGGELVWSYERGAEDTENQVRFLDHPPTI
jgi:hypothetical protein